LGASPPSEVQPIGFFECAMARTTTRTRWTLLTIRRRGSAHIGDLSPYPLSGTRRVIASDRRERGNLSVPERAKYGEIASSLRSLAMASIIRAQP